MKKIINMICLILSFIFLGIGCAGIFLPLLPSTPFLVFALMLFAKSSERFHRWFLSTKIYKKHLESIALHKSMYFGDKIKVLLMITVLFTAAMLLAPGRIAKSVIGAIALLHYMFFLFRIKTLKKGSVQERQEEI